MPKTDTAKFLVEQAVSLMAEIGDVRRFHSKKALVAFAGIDAFPHQSGQSNVRSRSISKRGSSATPL